MDRKMQNNVSPRNVVVSKVCPYELHIQIKGISSVEYEEYYAYYLVINGYKRYEDKNMIADNTSYNRE